MSKPLFILPNAPTSVTLSAAEVSAISRLVLVAYLSGKLNAREITLFNALTRKIARGQSRAIVAEQTLSE
jgi:hypothetical protein